jgi:hypothetical protein
MALPLDVNGEELLDVGHGEIEARAAFMDLSIEGRWGGIISGDKISISFAKCRCGHQGPTVRVARSYDSPTYPTATRSVAQAASTHTFGVCHEF